MTTRLRHRAMGYTCTLVVTRGGWILRADDGLIWHTWAVSARDLAAIGETWEDATEGERS